MTTCPVCATPVGERSPGAEPGILSCEGCGSGVTVPPPTRDVNTDGLFEEGSYAGGRLDQRRQWLSEAATRIDWIEQHAAPSSLLEIGAATGELLSVAGERGWDCYGVEPSPWAAGHAAELVGDGAMFVGDLAAWVSAHPDMRVDAIAAFHVLEHVHDQASFLRDLRHVLVPHGMLFIEVPNWASRDAQNLRERWRHASIADHVVHFTPASLENHLANHGWQTAEVSSITMRRYMRSRAWQGKWLETLKRGQLGPSRELLRVVAQVTQEER